MSAFDEQLNALLSNPDSMAQIMQLAQSLSGGQQGGGPVQNPVQNPAANQSPAFNAPPVSQANTAPSGGGLLSSLTGGLDPKLIGRLLPILQELNSNQDSNARALIYALRPYLKPQRQEKVERALQLARLIHLGKKFLSGWEG